MKLKSINLYLLILLSSCTSSTGIESDVTTASEESKEIALPSKANANDNDALSSPINSYNLDQYLFRDDIQYVDLRNLSMVIKEGYVAGFSFIPFYQIIASFSESQTLYTMTKTVVDGKTLPAGQIGTFVNHYEESKDQIEFYFSKNKPIFFISQGGSESAYMINLLIQLGYDGNLLYNVGGVSNSEGIPSYKDIKANKYYVSPGVTDIDIKFDLSFLDELTPTN